MPDTAIYCVSTTGSVVNGFDPEKVVLEFSSLFKIPRERAVRYIEQKQVIKQNLALDNAEKYRDTLLRIGLDIDILDANGEVYSKEPASIGVLPDIEAAKVSDDADAGFSCPKCQKLQVSTDQCVACGVYVEKFEAAQNAYGMAGSITASSGRTGGQAGGRAGRSAERVASSQSVVVEDDSLSLKGLAFAAFAAVTGAFVWYLMVKLSGYELGIIAWGVGVAIGLAAAAGGSRSDVAGIACGVLVVMAIFGGKFMAMSSIAADYEASFEDESSAELLAVYEEFLVDANGFGNIDISDNDSVKTFMVEHRFIDAEASGFVNDEELAYFRAEYQPGLEMQLESPMDFGEWKNEMTVDMETVFQDYSVVDMVVDSLGLMDIVFLVLGISTAFQLARRGREAS